MLLLFGDTRRVHSMCPVLKEHEADEYLAGAQLPHAEMLQVPAGVVIRKSVKAFWLAPAARQAETATLFLVSTDEWSTIEELNHANGRQPIHCYRAKSSGGYHIGQVWHVDGEPYFFPAAEGLHPPCKAELLVHIGRIVSAC